ncbi:methylenetetrahydrofolate reductase [NAD(P)H] [Hutsoniella sourekii]
MKTKELFKDKTILSYEVFPPKKATNLSSIYHTLDELKELSPDCISVTYGAGGGGNHSQSLAIAQSIKDSGIPAIAHLPCIGMTQEELLEILQELEQRGIENILALRGDLPDGQYAPGDFEYASDMIAFIKDHGDFNIVAACYPEGHIDTKNKVEDIKHLKIKVDAGVDHLITQLFLDNQDFYAFKERCELAGIEVPIEAGIMPVVNKSQIERMTSLCGVKLPSKFTKMMDRYQDNPVAMRDAGIAYAVNQIVDLISQGVDGIHLYTMNNPYIAKRIYQAVHNLI